MLSIGGEGQEEERDNYCLLYPAKLKAFILCFLDDVTLIKI